MNFADYARINGSKYADKLCLIERTPNTNARRALTWKAFNTQANRLANYLTKNLGIKKGDYILHLQNNSLEWGITYFGIIKTGAVVVPLNFRFIGSDIRYAAAICRPVTFILEEAFLDRVNPIREYLSTVKQYIVVGEACPPDMVPYSEIEDLDDTDEATIDVQEDDYLALMFTSGTTGQAKPVIHTHGSMTATAIGNGMSTPVEINDKYIIIHPLYHSGSLFLWTPYYAVGATGILILDCRDPKWIIEAIAEEGGTGLLAVVPICVDLIDLIKSGTIDLKNYDLSSWKYIMTGAQPVPQEVLRSLIELLPCQTIHTYGVTEAGGGVVWILNHDDILRKPGSIGKPNFGVEGKVVDEKGNWVPPGDVGELIIKTPRLMKGYYENQELTARSIKDGFFYTGDLAKVDEEGYYYIVDRKKDMITCGGENIYPVEIEDVLHEHPAVDDVAVIGYPDKRFVEIVMAVVELKKGTTLSEVEVIEFCKSKLAWYKAPRKVVFDHVPRNPTGKLMKPALREKYTGKKEAFNL